MKELNYRFFDIMTNSQQISEGGNSVFSYQVRGLNG